MVLYRAHCPVPPEVGTPIEWRCDTCGDDGVISGWEDSFADLRYPDGRPRCGGRQVPVPDHVAAALRDLRLLDTDSERAVYAARADRSGRGAIIEGAVSRFLGRRLGSDGFRLRQPVPPTQQGMATTGENMRYMRGAYRLVVLTGVAGMMSACASTPSVVRGGVVEVTFSVADSATQAGVARTCSIRQSQRLSPVHVSYTFSPKHQGAVLSCLEQTPLVRVAALPG